VSHGVLVAKAREGAFGWVAEWLADDVADHGWTRLSVAVLRHLLGYEMPPENPPGNSGSGRRTPGQPSLGDDELIRRSFCLASEHSVNYPANAPE
jgi:hypothetical protein